MQLTGREDLQERLEANKLAAQPVTNWQTRMNTEMTYLNPCAIGSQLSRKSRNGILLTIIPRNIFIDERPKERISQPSSQRVSWDAK